MAFINQQKKILKKIKKKPLERKEEELTMSVGLRDDLMKKNLQDRALFPPQINCIEHNQIIPNSPL